MIFFGSLLIFLGGFWLLNNLGIISTALWDVLWPSVLILLGVKLVVTPGKWRRFWNQFGDGKKIKID